VQRELDEALRFSAKAYGSIEPDTSTEGCSPRTRYKPPAISPSISSSTSSTPDLRHLGWARYEQAGDQIVVHGPGGVIGSWPLAVFDEILRPYRDSADS
jgi:hypothetical protein